VILQVWFALAWKGRWRLAACVPLIGFVPALIYALYALWHGSNLWPFTVIVFAPFATAYLVITAIARLIADRRRTA
jgi:hypothetical protein